jgi:hypothetical protein
MFRKDAHDGADPSDVRGVGAKVMDGYLIHKRYGLTGVVSNANRLTVSGFDVD